MKGFIVLLVALSFVKVYSIREKSTEIQIGAPWLVPIDSPQAACIRNPDEPIAVCGIAGGLIRMKSAWTLAKLPACRGCYEASLDIARFVSGRPNAPDPTISLD